MNKFAKTAGSTPKARLPEGARILSPQKVDIATSKAMLTKAPHSQSQQNLETGFSRNPRIKPPGQDLFDGPQVRGPGAQNFQTRPDTAQVNFATEYSKGITGGLRNASSGARPMTSSDGYGTRQAQTQRNNQNQRPEFKIKKMNSLFPTQKTGNLITNDIEAGLETTKEDREAVEELERWDSEYKILAISKALESDQKKDQNQGQYQSEKFESYKTPSLNREIINIIDEDDVFAAERDGKFMTTTVTNMNKQKARVPQKSLETIMTEYNKKILNEILYQRVSKKLNSKDLAAQGNRLDLDYTTKTVSTDTIGNFKNLQHTMQTNPRIIEYENLYQKLNVKKNLPEKIFDLEEDRKKIQDAENDYGAIEAALKVQFESVINEIHKKKETLNELRLTVHNNNIEIKDIEGEVDDIAKKYEVLEAQYNQQREQNKALNRMNTRHKRTGIKEVNKQAAHIEEYSKVQRQMEEKKEQMRELREKIEDLESENQKSQQKLNNLEREIKDLKFKKNQLRLQLKQLYIKILKNEEHIFKNESSFITIIKNMWKINEEVLEDMFPSFVDRESLAYLTENARLEYELEQLEQLAKNEGLKDFQYSDPHQRDEIYNRFVKTQNSLKLPLSEQLADVRQRLQNLKKGIVKMKRPVFIKDGSSKSRVIRWEELNLETDDLTEHHLAEQQMQEKINQAIVNLKNKLAELKEKEISRIFNLYINKEIEEKNLRNLNKILLSLFGKQNAEKIYLRFVRLKQAHDFKINQNKTFVFSSTKQSSSSLLNDKNKNSYTLMLAFASNFRPEKNKQPEEKKDHMQQFTQQVDEYQERAQLEVNYDYNLNYNYASDLQDKDPKSSFYINRIVSPSESNNTRGGLRDKNRMIKTASSFNGNRVTFKEPVMSALQAEESYHSSQPNLARKYLKSAE